MPCPTKADEEGALQGAGTAPPRKLNSLVAADCVTHADRAANSAASLHACHGLNAQKHLRCTMVGPDSSYSVFEIHICWNVDSDDRIDRRSTPSTCAPAARSP